jgi:hypothetical protein
MPGFKPGRHIKYSAQKQKPEVRSGFILNIEDELFTAVCPQVAEAVGIQLRQTAI